MLQKNKTKDVGGLGEPEQKEDEFFVSHVETNKSLHDRSSLIIYQ